MEITWAAFHKQLAPLKVGFHKIRLPVSDVLRLRHCCWGMWKISLWFSRSYKNYQPSTSSIYQVKMPSESLFRMPMINGCAEAPTPEGASEHWPNRYHHEPLITNIFALQNKGQMLALCHACQISIIFWNFSTFRYIFFLYIRCLTISPMVLSFPKVLFEMKMWPIGCICSSKFSLVRHSLQEHPGYIPKT